MISIRCTQFLAFPHLQNSHECMQIRTDPAQRLVAVRLRLPDAVLEVLAVVVAARGEQRSVACVSCVARQAREAPSDSSQKQICSPHYLLGGVVLAAEVQGKVKRANTRLAEERQGKMINAYLGSLAAMKGSY